MIQIENPRFDFISIPSLSFCVEEDNHILKSYFNIDFNMNFNQNLMNKEFKKYFNTYIKNKINCQIYYNKSKVNCDNFSEIHITIKGINIMIMKFVLQNYLIKIMNCHRNII